MKMGDHHFFVLTEPDLHIRSGEHIFVSVDWEKINLFNKQTGKSLLKM